MLTNTASIKRWIDQFTAELGRFRAQLDAEPEAIETGVNSYFVEAREARALWATQTTREGELLQGTESDLSKEGFSDSMGRMLFGSFFRRRSLADRIAKPPAPSNGQNKTE